jgi:hypothetical protein
MYTSPIAAILRLAVETPVHITGIYEFYYLTFRVSYILNFVKANVTKKEKINLFYSYYIFCLFAEIFLR